MACRISIQKKNTHVHLSPVPANSALHAFFDHLKKNALFPECIAKGFVSLWGSGPEVESLDIALLLATVRKCPQSSAAMRNVNRPQPLTTMMPIATAFLDVLKTPHSTLWIH